MDLKGCRVSVKTAAITVVLSLLAGLIVVEPVSAQSRRRRTRARVANPAPPIAPLPFVRREDIESGMSFICEDRKHDPLGSSPIDLMQARPSLSLNHPDAMSGAQRARRLLPLARELTVKGLRQLATEYGVSQDLINQASLRVMNVTQVKADPDLRDNASVMMTNPKVINFGTIFLVGLPSEEGMISVLSHELTHIADGRHGSLAVLFQRLGRRASARTGLRISGQRAEELSCDMIGAYAVQSLLDRQPSSEEPSRRMARAIQHNCVDTDDTDEEHLSPRNTMRALLTLNPTLTRTVVNAVVRPEYRSMVTGSSHTLYLNYPQ